MSERNGMNCWIVDCPLHKRMKFILLITRWLVIDFSPNQLNLHSSSFHFTSSLIKEIGLLSSLGQEKRRQEWWNGGKVNFSGMEFNRAERPPAYNPANNETKATHSSIPSIAAQCGPAIDWSWFIHLPRRSCPPWCLARWLHFTAAKLIHSIPQLACRSISSTHLLSLAAHPSISFISFNQFTFWFVNWWRNERLWAHYTATDLRQQIKNYSTIS